jgi:rhodanese-related sulfurtransferase
MSFLRQISLLFIGVFILASSQLNAQEVGNKAFNLMLMGLLDESVTPIDVQTLRSRTDNVLLLDARERDEYSVSHLPNARHVGYDAFDLERLKGTPKDAEIVVYCSVGYRSEKIGERLLDAGFSNVKNLYGGIFEWSNQGLPLENEDGTTAQRIHAYDQIWGIWVSGDRIEKVYSNAKE